MINEHVKLSPEKPGNADILYPANGIYACTDNSTTTVSFVLENNVVTYEDNKHELITPLLANFRLALQLLEENPDYYYFQDFLSSQTPDMFSFTFECDTAAITLSCAEGMGTFIFSQVDLIKTIRFLEKL